MSDRPADDEALDRIDRGLDALVLADVARDLLEAVDVEALRNGAAFERAVDADEMRRALGGPVGRVVTRRLADRALGGGVAGLVGREVAGRVGASLVETLAERVDPEAMIASLEAMASEGATAPPDDEATVIEIDSDE